MFLRSAMLACAAAAIVSTAAFAQTAAPARCEEASFRIYFTQGSATLDATAMEMLDAAERTIAGCAYSELHVTVDGANAAARGAAIRTALNDRAWNVVRIEPRGMRLASLHGGPDYAEVLMTPRAVPARARAAERERRSVMGFERTTLNRSSMVTSPPYGETKRRYARLQPSPELRA